MTLLASTFNMLLTDEPSAVAPLMMATAISTAIRPYSMAVAPDRSCQKRARNPAIIAPSTVSAKTHPSTACDPGVRISRRVVNTRLKDGVRVEAHCAAMVTPVSRLQADEAGMLLGACEAVAGHST